MPRRRRSQLARALLQSPRDRPATRAIRDWNALPDDLRYALGRSPGNWPRLTAPRRQTMFEDYSIGATPTFRRWKGRR
jgi:hypothetical protein